MKTLFSILLSVNLGLSVALEATADSTESEKAVLESVGRIHGEAGPFATAGYRIGERALKELGMKRGSFMLEVVHHSPKDVQFGCVADGLQAATGVSAGKMNLLMEVASRDHLHTVVRDKKSGKVLLFRLTPKFMRKFLNQSPQHAQKHSLEILRMADEEIFSVVTQVPGLPGGSL